MHISSLVQRDKYPSCVLHIKNTPGTESLRMCTPNQCTLSLLCVFFSFNAPVWLRTVKSLFCLVCVESVNQFQVRVVGVAVDHVCIRSASVLGGRGGWVSRPFSNLIGGLVMWSGGILTYTEIVFPRYVSLQRTSLSSKELNPQKCPSPVALLTRPTRF